MQVGLIMDAEGNTDKLLISLGRGGRTILRRREHIAGSLLQGSPIYSPVDAFKHRLKDLKFELRLLIIRHFDAVIHHLPRSQSSILFSILWGRPLLSEIRERVMPSDLEFPVLDFEKSKTNFAAFAREVFEASRTWGFFILENHGIDGVDRAFHLVRSSLVPVSKHRTG